MERELKEAEEKRRKEIEDRKQHEEEEERKRIEHLKERLGEEPEEGGADVSLIVFRLPTGNKRIQRLFRKTDTI